MEGRPKILVVGVGALGGVLSARLRASGRMVWLATRDAQQAARLRASGLRVSGVGGAVSVELGGEVAPLEAYGERDAFDLVVLATKARDAMQIAPTLVRVLGPGGVLLPIQNGGVAQLLAGDLGHDRILGGLSNLGATMHESGAYEQRNAGHLLVGELSGGDTARAERVREAMRGVEVRVTANLGGAVWSKLLLNCSVTTLGAIAGRTMREYIALPQGRRLFDLAYGEALAVALAIGVQPQRMVVEPIPPGWSGRAAPGEAHEAWLRDILAFYGDVKPSMLQDFERGRPTEIDFINGYVVEVGRAKGIPTPANAAIVETAYAITRGELRPDPSLLTRTLGALG